MCCTRAIKTPSSAAARCCGKWSTPGSTAAKADEDSTSTTWIVPSQEIHSSMEDNKVRIRAFLARFFQNHELKDDEDIFSLGFVNSMFAMQLVLFVEKEFQVTIEDEDLDFENFRTIDALDQLVQRKNGVART